MSLDAYHPHMFERLVGAKAHDHRCYAQTCAAASWHGKGHELIKLCELCRSLHVVACCRANGSQGTVVPDEIPRGASSQFHTQHSGASNDGLPRRLSSNASMPDEGGDVFPGPSAAALGVLEPVGEAGPAGGGAMQLDQRPSW